VDHPRHRPHDPIRLPGLFSAVVILAHAAHPDHLPTRQAAWYAKPAASFSDALAAGRRQLWVGWNWPPQPTTQPPATSPLPLLDFLVEAACYAA